MATTETTTDLLNRQAAAEWLAQQMIGDDKKTPEQWALWLRNNANHARQAIYRIPTERFGGGTFYNIEELRKYAEWAKLKWLGTLRLSGRAAQALKAFGIGEAGGGTLGRKWKGAHVNLHPSSDGSEPIVQMIVNQPLMVFALSLSDAAELGRALVKESLDGMQQIGKM